MRKLLLTLLIVLLPVSVNAATITRYVNTASAGGDGTTNGESGATAAYASLNAWNIAEATNLDTANNIHVVHLSTGSGAAADATVVDLSAWTTSATDYLVIQQDDDHGGAWNTSAYRLDTTTAGDVLKIQADFVRVVGLQIRSTAASGVPVKIRIESQNASNDLRFEKVIVRGGATGGSWEEGFWINSANVIPTIWNSIIYANDLDTNSKGIAFNSASDGNIYSTTVHGNYTNVSGLSGTPLLKNVLSSDNTGGSDYAGASGDYDANSTYNLSSDGTAANFGTNNLINKTVVFTSETAGSEDLHLDSTDTAALDAGLDTSGDAAPLDFTDDIDGDTRSGTWDIGADEFVAAGGAARRRMIIMN